MTETFAICVKRTYRKACMVMFRVIRPVRDERGGIRNLCPHCRGPLKELTPREVREEMDAKNELRGGSL